MVKGLPKQLSAYDKLNKLIEEFQNRLIEKIAELKNQEVIEKFKEPRYQLVLHDAIKESINNSKVSQANGSITISGKDDVKDSRN